MAKKPNLVFFICDSMDGRKMGHMGCEPLKNATPNLDMLAQSGTTFENTYCTNPVCVCSRASMLSGKYTFNCHAWNNYKGIPANSETMFKALERDGYAMGLYGKTDYVSGAHSQRARITAWLRSAKVMLPQYDMGAPIIREDDDRRCHEGDWKKIDSALDFLKNHQDGEQPWFLYVSLGLPHPRCMTNQRYLSRIDQAAIRIPPKDEHEHPVMAYMRMAKNWQHSPDEESVRRARAVYYAMIAEVDEMVGEVMNAVKDPENTYFFFASDHGEMNMEHGQFYKFTAFEPSARVPWIVRGPGIGKGQRVEHIASLIDVFPTVMDITGGSSPARMDGQSVLPVLRGEPFDRPNEALLEYYDSGAYTGIIMLRRDNWKYVAYPGCAPQLFDLSADPWEVHDLADKMPEKCAEMDARLREYFDYEAHDLLVKEYDRDNFRTWRDAHRQAGDYDELMARAFCGADDWGKGVEKPVPPWTAENEKLVNDWLEAEFR